HRHTRGIACLSRQHGYGFGVARVGGRAVGSSRLPWRGVLSPGTVLLVRRSEEIELGRVSFDALAVANPGGGGEVTGQRLRDSAVVPHGGGSGAEFAGQQDRLQWCSASRGRAGRGRDRGRLFATSALGDRVSRLATSGALVRRRLLFAPGFGSRAGRFFGGL